MKRIMSVLIAIMISLMIATAGFAGGKWEGDPGLYVKVKGGNLGEIKNFPHGQSTNSNSEWQYVGPAPDNGCSSGLCKKYQIGNYKINAGKEFEGSFDQSGTCRNPGNDYAVTGGGATIYAKNYNVAGGSFLSGQAGFVDGDAKLCSFTIAKDYGLSSFSFAKATVYADAIAAGGAYSLQGCGTLSTSDTWVKGTAAQFNTANEVGYNGANAAGWNTSEASFSNDGSGWSTSNKYISASFSYAEGSATTEGFTKVRVSPYGDNRSAWGETGNSSFGNDGVSGKGMIQTEAYKNGVYTSGMSSFSYKGAVSGTGYATSNSVISTGANSFSARSSGFSFSKTGGSTPR